MQGNRKETPNRPIPTPERKTGKREEKNDEKVVPVVGNNQTDDAAEPEVTAKTDNSGLRRYWRHLCVAFEE